MQRLRLKTLIVLLLVASAPSARAFEVKLLEKPLRIDITESLITRMRPWDSGGVDAVKAYYHDGVNRLNVQANWNRFTLGIRLDSNAYFNTPQAGQKLANEYCSRLTSPASCTVGPRDLTDRFQTHWFDPTPLGGSPARKFFEKTWLSWSNDNVDATLGDSYVNLGRGLVLSLRKVDQLSSDTTLLGGKLGLKFGDFSTTLLGGVTNIQNRDDLEARYIPDPYDVIVGGRADYRIAGKVSVGLEGVWGDQPNGQIIQQRDRHTRVGLVVDAPRPLPWLSLYGEYVRAYQTIDTDTQQGSALYLSANVLAGITSWLFEFKNYQNFKPWKASPLNATSTVYAAPPTLERVLVQIIDDTNVVAGRLKTDVRLNPNLSFYLSPELGAVHPALGQHNLLADAYGGAEVRWNDNLSHVFPIVEVRREWDQKGPLVENLLALELDAAQVIGNGWSAELQGLIWFRERPAESRPWQEGTVYLGAKWAPRFFAAVGYEFINADKFLQAQHNFVNGQVQWEFTSSTSLTLFVGGRRPGLRCISGVCRNFPAFQGVELSFVARG